MKQTPQIFQFEQLFVKLPFWVCSGLKKLPDELWEQLQEIRLQEGKPPCLILPGRMDFPKVFDGRCITGEEIEKTFAALCEYSVHTYLPQIQNGFLTIPGGHRVGLGGVAVLQQGKVSSFQKLTSLNIRLARDVCGASEEFAEKLFVDGKCSVLIAGAPSSGKTTLLRSLSLWLSQYYRVTVVDERGEIMGGTDQKQGGCLDVLGGFPKQIGIMQAVRTLSPEIVVCDEIGDGEETNKLLEAMNCGVCFVASIHAKSAEELQRKPQYLLLSQKSAFDRVVFLQGADRPGEIQEMYRCQQDGKLVKI